MAKHIAAFAFGGILVSQICPALAEDLTVGLGNAKSVDSVDRYVAITVLVDNNQDAHSCRPEHHHAWSVPT